MIGRLVCELRNQKPEIPNSEIQMSAFTELAGLSASVDRVVHMPQLEAPPDRPHPFVYFITIRNDSPATVTIKDASGW